MLILISALLAGLLLTLELDTTNATAISYDLATGTLTVSGPSGETIASGEDVESVYAQLHP